MCGRRTHSRTTFLMTAKSSSRNARQSAVATKRDGQDSVCDSTGGPFRPRLKLCCNHSDELVSTSVSRPRTCEQKKKNHCHSNCLSSHPERQKHWQYFPNNITNVQRTFVVGLIGQTGRNLVPGRPATTVFVDDSSTILSPRHVTSRHVTDQSSGTLITVT